MALNPTSIFESDNTGTSETIMLQPASSKATIASAVYGGELVPVADDRKSLTFTVLKKVNPLVITLASPNPDDEMVALVQGGTTLARPVITQHSGVSSILIQGT